ncbi:Cell wall binding repeat 2-containing protein [Methanocaldococcus lauensis]|uniref:Cell wall binding repeat 2-containing protein n=1 Tax=Methanocaldococcus lauensis TaxID=2546128 RepID=A0A8D6PSQ7_9EURY|nr:cell wall-binding repeat-containing protein [Methanocaldococcus lauensis]CAB3287238.1 Cell wall binding repeat 2-containing protein [Methanocaldococcus lauensis]
MIIKKMVVLLLSLVALPIVSTNTVVLVSDNCADQATALELAKALNATVVTTTWGVYDENVVNEILALNPDKVIIIGGPLAVVENYTTALENAGITVERVGGQTRYETNANVTLRFQNQFKNAFGNNVSACVCYGLDDIALNESMEKIRDGHCLLLLTNGTNLSVEPTRLQLRIQNIEVIENPICPFCNYSRITNMLMHRGFKVNVTKISDERVKLMLQNRIRLMEMKIERLKNLGVNTTDLENKLNEVIQLMNQNRYQEAYRIMVQLQEMHMVMVRLHLHPMWHGGMANGTRGFNNQINKMNETVSHINYHIINASKGYEKAPHIYYKNINNNNTINIQ